MFKKLKIKKFLGNKKIRKYLSKKFNHLNSKFHLKYICKNCPLEKRLTRDILDIGECFWYHSWSNNNYDIPKWMGTRNFFRVKFKKQPLIMKINDEILYGKAPIIKKKKFSRFFVKSMYILKKIKKPKK